MCVDVLLQIQIRPVEPTQRLHALSFSTAPSRSPSAIVISVHVLIHASISSSILPSLSLRSIAFSYPLARRGLHVRVIDAEVEAQGERSERSDANDRVTGLLSYLGLSEKIEELLPRTKYNGQRQ